MNNTVERESRTKVHRYSFRPVLGLSVSLSCDIDYRCQELREDCG
jgi:hypothetical protein